MQSIKLAKSCFQETRTAIVDPFLSQRGFARRGKSDIYEKNPGEYFHQIWFEADFLKHDVNGVHLLIDPVVQWRIPEIGEKVSEITEGDPFLVANATDLVIGQPIRHFVVGNTNTGWEAVSAGDYEAAILSICELMDATVFPLLENMQSIDDFIGIYETNEPRIVKQQHRYVLIAAAYLIKSRNNEAKLVMEKHLGSPGLRKRYSPVFEYIGRLE